MVIRTTSTQQMTFALPEPVRVWTPPEDYRAPESLPELHGIVALDFETKDPGITLGKGSSWWNKNEGFICGAAFVADDLFGYAPIAHAVGNMDPMLFWTWLRKQASKPDVTFVMANSIYDAGWLSRHDITPANSPYDVQAMAYLLNEHRPSYSLSSLAKSELGEDKLSGSLVAEAKRLHVAHPMSNMDKLPAWTVAPYGIMDAVLTRKLYHHYLPLLEADGLMVAHELERECAMVAIDMRRLGVKIDMDRVATIKKDFMATRDAHIKAIHEATGVHIAPFDMDSCSRALLAENSQVTLGTTERGKVSVAKEVLEKIDSTVSLSILKARRLEKAIGTFIVGAFETFVVDGRAHCEFHPTRRNDDNDSEFSETTGGTVTARFSSSKFNFQNLPIRDPDIGPALRSCCVPDDPEQEWGKLDWASQEPRLTVHFASLVNLSKDVVVDINDRLPRDKKLSEGHLRGALEMRQRFIDNPNTDLHAECAVLMGVARQSAKIINLALTYGAQGANISNQLGLPTKQITTKRGLTIDVAGPEAQALLDKHFEGVPFIKGVFEVAKYSAEHRGYVKLIDGRRLHLEKYMDGNYVRPYKALNMTVQGSAAVQMKMALVAMRKAGIHVNLTVHDETDRPFDKGAAGDRLKRDMIEIMETCVKLTVPMIAELKVGVNWGAVE